MRMNRSEQSKLPDKMTKAVEWDDQVKPSLVMT